MGAASLVLHHGDCLDVMRGLPAGSVDAIVTDPPYELGFMGKRWDATGVAYNVDLWRAALAVLKPDGYLLAFGGTRTYHRMVCAIEDAGFEIRDMVEWIYGSGFPKGRSCLKPAHEPVVLARKGRGRELNIDAGRVGIENLSAQWDREWKQDGTFGNGKRASHGKTVPAGRWPANLILDEEAAAMLDAQSGNRPGMASGGKHKADYKGGMFGGIDCEHTAYADSGGASRFFYVAKASRAERGEGNTHPTVKPIALMDHLIRLVTPPGGTVLDPFMGSGTTGLAALRGGFSFIGIEQNADYLEIARRRLAADQPVRMAI